MSLDVFSQPWAEAWAAELSASDAYRQAAATWEGSIVLETGGGDAEPANGVFVDLWHGECRAARVAAERDREQADFIIQTTLDNWQRVLSGELEPVFGIMSGKLKLLQGSLAKLVPQVPAARELVAAAARIDTAFPAG